jgi:hypothetical protein
MPSLTHDPEFRFKTLDVLLDMGYDEKAIDFLPSYGAFIMLHRP